MFVFSPREEIAKGVGGVSASRHKESRSPFDAEMLGRIDGFGSGKSWVVGCFVKTGRDSADRRETAGELVHGKSGLRIGSSCPVSEKFPELIHLNE